MSGDQRFCCIGKEGWANGMTGRKERQWEKIYTQRQIEADRGRFDAYLLRNGIAVAYTDYDVVKKTDNFRYD